MSHFFKGGKVAAGASTGANRRITPWRERGGKQHSVLWLIDNATDPKMLEDVLRFANFQTEASPGTRRRWADAAEKRIFILERNPPRFEKVDFEEYAEELKRQMPGFGDFQAIRQKELLVLTDSQIPKAGQDYLPVSRDGPTAATMSEEVRVAIEAAEVPRYVDPALVLAREERGRMAKYSDGASYGTKVAQTVTEMRVLATRFKCPPWERSPIGKWAEEECIYREWDIKFYAGEQDVTLGVAGESHPDTMRLSKASPGAALFSAMHGVAPVEWKRQIEAVTGRPINYDQSVQVVSNGPARVGRGVSADPTAKIYETLKRMDDISLPPS